MKNKIIVSVIVVVVAGLSFYLGKVYSASSKTSTSSRGQFNSGQFTGSGRGVRAGGGFSGGEVISKDDSGVTLKSQDGSTKIILISKSTQVMKSTSGSIEDVSVGENLMVTGVSNADGSITAQTVQIRPAVSDLKKN